MSDSSGWHLAARPGGPLHTDVLSITNKDGSIDRVDTEGRGPATVPGPGPVPRDAVAPRPLPRGFVHTW
jgi:hypothetical protein